jgi:hypothetical protein
MALLYGTVKYLLDKEDCPKVLVTTHFVEAVEFLRAFSHPNIEYLTMDFMVFSTFSTFSLISSISSFLHFLRFLHSLFSSSSLIHSFIISHVGSRRFNRRNCVFVQVTLPTFYPLLFHFESK